MENEKNYQVSNETALAVLKSTFSEAEETLKDEDKLEKLLVKVEEKIKKVPLINQKLSEIPVFILMVRSYIKKEYTEIPVGSIIAIIGALIYFLSAIDIIPDVVPGIGFADDTAVVAACLMLVESDIMDYNTWRKENGLIAFDFVIDGEIVE